MKTLLTIAVCLVTIGVPAHATPDILDIKIEWLNAKECGLDGCRPQRVIMRQGTTMTFGWGPGPELEKRGDFNLFPTLHGDALKLRISRTRAAAKIAEDEREFQMGSPQDMVLKEVRLRITITEFQEPVEKK